MILNIYCTLNFQPFPFDNHECDLSFGSSSIWNDSLIMEPTKIRFLDEYKRIGDGKLHIKQGRLPFNIKMESLDTFNHTTAGYTYSYCAVRFYFQRNDLGLLLGSFYLPTLLFSILSLVSFFISPDMVKHYIQIIDKLSYYLK